MDKTSANNARGVLIILVIFGHLLEQRLDVNAAAGATYIFLYAFHMPAFAFLSGSASHARTGPVELRNTAIRLLQPLIICQLLFLPLEMILADEGKNWLHYAVTPYWVLWYLLSLAGWRLLLPAFVNLRHPLAWAIGLAIAAGFMSSIGYQLSLSRMLVLFPFFLAGHLMLASGTSLIKGDKRERIIAMLAMALAAVGAIALQANGFDEEFLYHAKGYGVLGLGAHVEALARVAALAVAAVLVWSFLVLMPRDLPAFVTRAGTYSLFCFLSHALLIKAAEAAGVFESWPGESMSWLFIVASMVFAAGLSLILTSRPLQAVQDRLYSPFRAA